MTSDTSTAILIKATIRWVSMVSVIVTTGWIAAYGAMPGAGFNDYSVGTAPPALFTIAAAAVGTVAPCLFTIAAASVAVSRAWAVSLCSERIGLSLLYVIVAIACAFQETGAW